MIEAKTQKTKVLNSKIPQKKKGPKKARKRFVPGMIYEKPNLTSFIDVTFLLLVFFVLSLSVDTAEGELETYLPKDNDTYCYPAVELQDMRVKLLWQKKDGTPIEDPRDNTKGHVVVKMGRKAYNKPSELNQENGEHAVWAKLCEDLKKLKEATPKNAELIIDARQQVPHGYVISAVNKAVEAGFQQVTFAAPELDYGDVDQVLKQAVDSND